MGNTSSHLQHPGRAGAGGRTNMFFASSRDSGGGGVRRRNTSESHEVKAEPELEQQPRPRAQTVSEGSVRRRQQHRLPTLFKWEAGGKQVFLGGSFTDWKPISMVHTKHGHFVSIIDLPEGDHEYKYYVDGVWRHNPKEKVVTSLAGRKTNLLKIKREDFNVFEALDMDEKKSQSSKKRSGYSQEIPNYANINSKVPMLPPHLVESVLNKEPDIDPGAVSEPSRVQLNHLYTQSVQDGVIVLSRSVRYRDSMITTQYYKPL